MKLKRATRWIGGALVAVGITWAASASAIPPEAVVFRDFNHFKFLNPDDWKANVSGNRVEWTCKSDSDCEFFIGFASGLTYFCPPKAKLTLTQGQLMVPAVCTVP